LDKFPGQTGTSRKEVVKEKDGEMEKCQKHYPASLGEVDTQVEIANRLMYISPNTKARIDSMMVTVDRSLYGLWKKKC